MSDLVDRSERDSAERPDSPAVLPGVSGEPQWRAEHMQLVNWGGFHGYVRIPFSPTSTLISGATGSGKSTILDAYLALMMDVHTPFNGASNDATSGRARSASQRSLLTYLRGKLDDTTDGGEDSTRVLRGSSTATWGAVAVTFVNDSGERFCALQLYLVPRAAVTDGQIMKRPCTVEGDLDLRELEQFVEGRFDKRALESRFTSLSVRSGYSDFITRVQTRLGIGALSGGSKALRLLARIQAGAAIPTVDALFRTLVLERPDTYRHADAAVAHFADLESAYAEMLTARAKQRVLSGIVDAAAERDAHVATISAVDALGLDAVGDTPLTHWAACVESVAVGSASAENSGAARRESERLEGLRAEVAELSRESEALAAAYRDAGGAAIEDLDARIAGLDARLVEVSAAAADFAARTEVLGLPRLGEESFAAAASEAQLFVDEGYDAAVAGVRVERDELQEAHVWPANQRRRELVEELSSLEGRAGRVPANLHDARVEAAERLGVAPAELPFVAELIDVPAAHAQWRVAAEAAFAGVATVLLVDERRLDEFSAAINDLRWSGVRVNYQGVRLNSEPPPSAPPEMLSARLEYRDDSPFIGWVRRRLADPSVDAICVEGPAQLRGPGRRVTREGQTREGQRGAHGRVRRHSIIGFDNDARRDEIRVELAAIDVELAEAGRRARELDARGAELTALRDAHRHVLVTRWAQIDVGSVSAARDELTEARERLLGADDTLAELGAELERVNGELEERRSERTRSADRLERFAELGAELERRAAELAADLERHLHAGVGHDEGTGQRLDEALLEVVEAGVVELTYSPSAFAAVLARVAQQLRSQRAEAATARSRCDAALVAAFEAYQERWPDPNLGTGVESYENYLEIFSGITEAGLAERRDEWARRVTSWAGEDLVPLATALSAAVPDIRARLGPVNAILAGLPFGARRQRLRIDLRELHHDDFAAFRKTLAELSSNVLGEASFAAVEERFAQLRSFIALIGPERRPSGNGRDYYLDVRRHIELSAVVLDSEGQITAKFTSLGGKSGGETQELVAFIVGAALRYQLGDEDRDRPRFAPVLLDEGFVKADAEFAGRSVRAWLGLGFQLIVATAFGTVSALEPHMDSMLSVTKDPVSGHARVHVVAGASA